MLVLVRGVGAFFTRFIGAVGGTGDGAGGGGKILKDWGRVACCGALQLKMACVAFAAQG